MTNTKTVRHLARLGLPCQALPRRAAVAVAELQEYKITPSNMLGKSCIMNLAPNEKTTTLQLWIVL